ncbi:MAG: hypothetical protein P9M00_02670 [Candidatus Tritonobacter lacicola]|nr:hypothetical protein [Candidatus Tritonobacter lacicola]
MKRLKTKDHRQKQKKKELIRRNCHKNTKARRKDEMQSAKRTTQKKKLEETLGREVTSSYNTPGKGHAGYHTELR